MKLKMIATASVLACAGSAYAQSSVTLYGVMDINVEYTNHVGNIPSAANGFNAGPSNRIVRMGSGGGLGGSRWGLRGTEDLGSGLKSIFVLESGFSADAGQSQQGGRLFGRQAYVGLQSNYGQLTFGRQYTSIFEALANFSPLSYATLYAPTVLLNGGNYREDNTVKYTGQFGPLTTWAHWSFGVGATVPQASAGAVTFGGNGEVPGQTRRDSAYGVAAMYVAGPFGASVGYDQWNPTIGGSSGTVKKAAVAASYTFGQAKVMAGYRWAQSKTPADVVMVRDDLYWVGANYQVTPAVVLSLEYSYDKVKNLFGDTGAPNPWQIALISTYSLSKRTDLYLSAAYSKNAGLTLDSAATGYLTSLSLGSSYALPNGANSMLGVAVGMRHKF